MICNLIQPAHSASIHAKAAELRDPLTIQGIPQAAIILKETAARGGTVFLTSDQPELTPVCVHLLRHALGPGSGAKFPADDPCPALLCLDERSATAALKNRVIDNRRLLVILPEHSADLSPEVTQIVSPFSMTVTLLKLLQAVSAADARKPFRKYVAVDLETTSNDIRTAGIVEIGAVKVRDGQIVDRFGRLVNPEKPISQGAYKVHGISDAEVANAPTFRELLPEFLDFIGDDLLVAHNGFQFDFPILWRIYREATAGKMLANRRFDTLPLARRLFPGQPNSVDALMQRFGIQDVGGRHRALDDTVYLTPIFERLQEVEQSLNRRTEHEELLEIVALGIFAERGASLDDSVDQPTEDALLFQLGARKLLSRFSELPESLQTLFSQHAPDIQQLFERLTSRNAQECEETRHTFSGRDISIARIKELAAAFPADTLRDAMQRFLDHAMLYATQDDIRDVNAVNLFTIHASKGLEFPVVFISGVEKGNLPSFYSVREEGELREQKLAEQRRLLYVAMTRAKQQLFISYVKKRGEYPKKRSQFLIELGIESQEECDGDHEGVINDIA